MDEPLSNLDAKLRVQMRAEIARIQRNLSVTTIYVTHDQVEAMTMGDRVAVLKDGYLQQVGAPQDLYDEPVNVFVGAFIGSPSMNLYEGVVTLDGQNSVQIGSQRVALAPESLQEHARLQQYNGQRVVVGIRPEDLEDAAVATGAQPDRRMKATVRLVEALGSELMVHLELDDAKRVNSGDPDAPEELAGEGVANAVAKFSPKSRVRVGEEIEISVTSGNLHFFDASTHRAIRS
jgi:multiple sugar transport system ATP-binding protein